MNDDGDGPTGRLPSEARGSPAPPKGFAWLGLGPEVRVWRSRRWDYVMGLLGLLMFVSNGFSAASGVSPLSWLTAVVGLGLALLALSDLLIDSGAARAAVALRAVAMLGFFGVFAGWAWAAMNGSGLGWLRSPWCWRGVRPAGLAAVVGAQRRRRAVSADASADEYS